MTVIEKKDYVLFVYMNIFFASANTRVLHQDQRKDQLENWLWNLAPQQKHFLFIFKETPCGTAAVFVGKDYDDSWCTVPYFVSIWTPYKRLELQADAGSTFGSPQPPSL